MSLALPKHHPWATLGRFVIAGGLNTALSYGVYLVLLRWLQPELAYTLAFVAGMLSSYLLARWFVFARPPERAWHSLWVPVIQLAQYGAGTLLVSLWVRVMGQSPVLAPLVALVLVLPATYWANRKVFSGGCSSS